MRLFFKTYLLIIVLCGIASAQIRTKELGLITDNDLYTSSKNDKYYTNGLTFYYRYLANKSNESVVKVTHEITFGQYVYTPRFLNESAVDSNDRPFAGYLFTGFEKSLFFANQNVLKVGIQVGTIGKNSYAEEFQENFHKAFHYKKIYGWENQIRNALSLQTHFLFSKKLFLGATQKTIDFNWKSEADLGTIFTEINTGLMTRIGFKPLLPVSNSNLYGATVGTTKLNNDEFYFYLAPSIRYQLYDATIQGSLFSDNSPLTFPIQPVRFNAKAGFVYRKNNFNLSYTFVYTTKEVAESPATGFFYGSIGVSFLLQ